MGLRKTSNHGYPLANVSGLSLPYKLGDMSMNYTDIPTGNAIPDVLFTVIEIPADHSPIKYEVDKPSGQLFVDRFLSTPMFYPANYGSVVVAMLLAGLVLREVITFRMIAGASLIVAGRLVIAKKP
jgi:hypothetical protein